MKTIQFVTFFISFWLLFSCKPNNEQILVDKQSNVAFLCSHDLSWCEKSFRYGKISVKSNQLNFVPETPFRLQVRYQGDLKLTKVTGKLMGKTMYMGMVPVIFDEVQQNMIKTTNSTQAEIMLGLCSEKNMVWQLMLTLEFANHQKEEVQLELTTHR